MLDFEKSFTDFIDGSEYDKAEGVLFSLLRASYTAGWLAAGGDPPPPGRARGLIREIIASDSPDDDPAADA